ncbi:hypothetical protein DITRI_Ditri12bG0014100 [Diplodiscus trichospermus]
MLNSLKGIYFPSHSFAEAKRGSRAFWTWSSILQGRELIEQNTVWQVFDGQNISIWKDPWIPSLPGLKLNHPGLNTEDIPSNVGELIIKEQGQWDLSSIEVWLPDEILNAIKEIPFGISAGNDRLIWPYTSQGTYIVKSGYKSLKMKEADPNAPPAATSHSVDKKHACSTCGLGKSAPPPSVLCAEMKKRQSNTCFCSGTGPLVCGLMSVQDLESTEALSKSGSLIPFEELELVTQFIKSTRVKKTRGQAGYGVVARNHEGHLLDGSNSVIGTSNALVSEAWAIREGTRLAITKKFQKVVIETDSANVYASIVNKGASHHWIIEPIIKDISENLHAIPEKKVRLTRRNANNAGCHPNHLGEVQP